MSKQIDEKWLIKKGFKISNFLYEKEIPINNNCAFDYIYYSIEGRTLNIGYALDIIPFQNNVYSRSDLKFIYKYLTGIKL